MTRLEGWRKMRPLPTAVFTCKIVEIRIHTGITATKDGKQGYKLHLS
ncbi:MAG: hypothetical protein QXK69_05065 [Candidatus Caldarchaeum sp.]